MSSVNGLRTEATVFGNYRVVRRVGSGGMASVYEAVHPGLNKRVAIKALHPEIASNEAVRQRFMREGETTSRIRHPNIVDITDIGLHEQIPYLVMEYLEGEDLSALIAREGRLSVEQTADLMIPVLAAIAAAHRAGVIHRDLKPANIFVARTAEGPRATVLDFGISKLLHPDERLPRISDELLLGTPDYMAPEQTRAGSEVDARTDQYALGVILYECLTGRPPYASDSIAGMLADVAAGNFLLPSIVRHSLPERIDDLIARAMSRERAERFASVEEMARALMPCAGVRTRLIWQQSVRGETSDSAALSMPTTNPPGPQTAAFLMSRQRDSGSPCTEIETQPQKFTSQTGDSPVPAILPARHFASRRAIAAMGAAAGMVLALLAALGIASARGGAPGASTGIASASPAKVNPQLTMDSNLSALFGAADADGAGDSLQARTLRNGGSQRAAGRRPARRPRPVRPAVAPLVSRPRNGFAVYMIPTRNQAPILY